MVRFSSTAFVILLLAACSDAGASNDVPHDARDAMTHRDMTADHPDVEAVPDGAESSPEPVDARVEAVPEGAPDAAEVADTVPDPVPDPVPDTVSDTVPDPAPDTALTDTIEPSDGTPPDGEALDLPPEQVTPPAGTVDDPIPVDDFPFVVADDTSLAPSDAIQAYACAPGVGEAGPERVYRLHLPAEGTLTVEVLEAAGVDVDVHVLTDLAENGQGQALHCVARANRRLVQGDLGPGQVFVVVDAYSQDGETWPGAHTLALEFTVPDQWQERVVAPGVLWRKKVYADLFGGHQTVNVLEVETTDPAVRVKPWTGSGACAATSAKGKGFGAVAALNGGFFNTETCESLDLVKIDGVVASYNHLLGSTQAQPTLGLSPAEVATIAPWPANHDWPEMPNALGGYPNLVTDGVVDVWPPADAIAGRNPRTAMGVQADGTLLLVTVDGRTEAGKGMTFDELAQYMLWLGADDAANLDGGGSTTLWIAGQSINGIVNHPSDNQAADHWGERKVSDGLLVLPQ